MKRWSVLAIAMSVAVGIAPAPAWAYVPVSQLQDLTPDHWSYAAIKALVEKYQVLEGNPDRTFRGARTLTRYELAAALARVMAKVEGMISSATGAPLGNDPMVNPEDLRTIARLQREFRDELEVLKGRVDAIDTRLKAVETRTRLAGEMRYEARDWLGAAPMASAPFAEYRLRHRIDLTTDLRDDLTTVAALGWDVYGARMSGNAFATNQAGTGTVTDMYVQRAYLRYQPGPVRVNVGLLNLSEVWTLGSSFRSPFQQSFWREGLGGYGFVGTPGMTVDGGGTLTRMLPQGGGPAPNSNPVWWLSGTDVVRQALDPNSAAPAYPLANFTAAAQGEAGPFSAGVAINQPGVAGRDVTRLGALGLPDSLPQPELYANGSRLVAQVGADFGAVRAQLAARVPHSFLDDAGVANKTVTAAVDLGSEAFGLSLQAVGRTAFTGNFRLEKASAQLGSDDLLGTGFGLGIGAVGGTVMNTALATPFGSGIPAFGFSAGNPNRSLLDGTSGMDYLSYGLTVRLPGIGFFPSFTVAAQQTAGPGMGPAIGSGLTLATELALKDWPRLNLAYSTGKFNPLDPATPTVDNGLLGSGLASHEQLSATMVVPF